MEEKKKHILKEIVGISFLVMILGLLVRSIGLYSSSRINDIIFPNNTSMFDFFKMYFYAVTFLVLIEYFVVYDLPNNYLLSRAFSVIMMMLFTLVTYTIYYLINGPHNLIFIVANYIVSIFIGQYFSYLIQRRRVIKWSFVLGFANYFVVAILLLTLTLVRPTGFFFNWYV